MFKRLIRWLCGPEATSPSVRQELRNWMRCHPRCREMAIPSDVFDMLLSELDNCLRNTVPQPYHRGLSTSVVLDGIEIFPDPSVIEFTRR